MVKGKEAAILCVSIFATLSLFFQSSYVSSGSAPLMVISKESATKSFYSKGSEPFFDGIILGGSNATYGLSASLLSETLGEQWSNLSMYGWYGSFDLFKQYLGQVSKQPRFSEIRTIVLSDIRFATPEVPLQRRDQLLKVSSDRLLPRGSFLSLIKAQTAVSQKIATNLFDSKDGDLKNYSYPGFGCTETMDAWTSVQRDLALSSDYVVSQTKIVHSVFPKAKILILVPPILSSGLTSKESISWRDALVKSTMSATSNSLSATVLPAEFLSRSSLYCNHPVHLNMRGRTVLTGNLARDILAFRKLSK
jgi:hypothetical protein